MSRVTMRRAGGIGTGVALVLAFSACYHSIITTELPPSGEVHREAFKAAFIAGLVPAQVDGSRYCAGRRWARVETQYSFLNWVVGVVTFGIFTPMDIRVFCAAGAPAAASADSTAATVTAGSP